MKQEQGATALIKLGSRAGGGAAARCARICEFVRERASGLAQCPNPNRHPAFTPSPTSHLLPLHTSPATHTRQPPLITHYSPDQSPRMSIIKVGDTIPSGEFGYIEVSVPRMYGGKSTRSF